MNGLLAQEQPRTAVSRFCPPDIIVGSVSFGGVSLRVAQQPEGQPDYVTTNCGEVTQFAMPARYGTIVILAHNYLEGDAFFLLHPGETVNVVYADGQSDHYCVAAIEEYQALKPHSPFSDFFGINGRYARQTLSSGMLFRHLFTTPGRLVLQTCIARGSIFSWGRRFVVAEVPGYPG